jgi:hypothetical protein
MLRLTMVSFALFAPFEAFASGAVTLLQPGGGFLAADGMSEVPLEVVFHAGSVAPPIDRVVIRPSIGRTSHIAVVERSRFRFIYAAPKRSEGFDETLEMDLTMKDGTTRTERISFAVSAPRAPRIELTVGPDSFEANEPRAIDVRARADDGERPQLALGSNAGALSLTESLPGPQTRSVTGRLDVPDLPTDAPSHLMVIAAATSRFGFVARAEGTSVIARVRLSVPAPTGKRVVIEGAEEDPGAVRSKKGRAIFDRVLVRQGAPIRAFAVQGDKRRPLKLKLPRGLEMKGAAIAIPGQSFADGGVGATILVGISPRIGAKASWPKITVKGAKLTDQIALGPELRALVLARPVKPREVSVLLDGEEVASIPFTRLRARKMKVIQLAPTSGERGAFEVVVTGDDGDPSDAPVPHARLVGAATDLAMERLSEGVYRIAVPAGSSGTELVAMLDQVPIVAGRSLPRPEVRKQVGAAPDKRSDAEPLLARTTAIDEDMSDIDQDRTVRSVSASGSKKKTGSSRSRPPGSRHLRARR